MSWVTLRVATRNPGKVRELEALLADLPLVLRDAAEMPEVAETGTTFEQNAALKARAAGRRRLRLRPALLPAGARLHHGRTAGRHEEPDQPPRPRPRRAAPAAGETGPRPGRKPAGGDKLMLTPTFRIRCLLLLLVGL